MQLYRSEELPTHGEPPLEGAGLLHCRDLGTVPFPQVTEQTPTTDHGPQLPLITDKKKFREIPSLEN